MRLELSHISKSFKKQQIVHDVNVVFESNHIYGIVGNNGSGKSVLLKLMSGLYKATEGEISLNGKFLKKDIDFLPSLGIIIEKPGFFDDLNAFDNLKLLASINNIIGDQEIVAAIEGVGLVHDKKPVRAYSLGMRQRLGIAQAIMEKPAILLLDEFSTGLDTDGVDLTHDIIRGYKNDNRIIILTSHSKYDIDLLCDTVYRMTNGTLHEV